MASLVSLPLPERTWWVFNDEQGPCDCCTYTQGYSGADGEWTCAKGNCWVVVDEPPTAAKPHAAEVCPGNCPQHPLLTPYLLAFMAATLCGHSWGDILAAEEETAEAALSDAERRAKAEREANARAAAELLTTLSIEASKMAAYADQKGVASRCKHAKGKVMEPCIWLYCDERAPKSTWYRNKKGELCAPKRDGLTGSACWAWEYVDPKTKQRKTPRTCDHLHPGEQGWLKEWDTDRTFRPGASRWDGLLGRSGGGGGYAAPKAAAAPVAKPVAAKPAPKSGGFAALASGWDSD